MQKKITAAILAGGPGSRMNGVVKPNLLLGQETILTRTLDVLKDIFNEIILVTNTPEHFIQYKGYSITADHYKGKGPIGGIHAALKASTGDAVFVFAGDMPFLSSELILKQSDLFHELDCEILVPRIGSSIEPLHSVYRRSMLKFLEEYMESSESYAVRDFFLKRDVKFMDLNNEMREIFSNINFPSDIPEIERIIKKEKHETF
ncbi:MAG TPA: molybdenum cofactor guanylyltransferase [Bacteroidales bacterium]|nr:molybdenum cofactor guanylyltransferase [Bacteroidales bacterium]